MKVTMLLCDYAQVADGKLYIMGGGWSVTGPDPVASALAIKLDVPWNQANRHIKLQLDLVDGDGRPVEYTGPWGTQRVAFEATFEVGRPPGLKEGTPIDVPFAISIPPLALEPGGRYSWELKIDGNTKAEWHLGFTTRAGSAARPQTI
jgi:hypothetical protein